MAAICCNLECVLKRIKVFSISKRNHETIEKSLKESQSIWYSKLIPMLQVNANEKTPFSFQFPSHLLNIFIAFSLHLQ